MTTYVVLNDALLVVVQMLSRCGYGGGGRILPAGTYDLEYVRSWCTLNVPNCDAVATDVETPGLPQGVDILYTVPNIAPRQTIRTEIGYVVRGGEEEGTE